jgi:transposase
VREQFAERFPETPVLNRNAVRRLTEKFREAGAVLDAERSGRPSKLNDKNLVDISDSMLRCPSKSLRKLGQQKDIGLATAHKAVREKLNLFPYKRRSAEIIAKKIKRVQTCIDARGHHFQHLL